MFVTSLVVEELCKIIARRRSAGLGKAGRLSAREHPQSTAQHPERMQDARHKD